MTEKGEHQELPVRRVALLLEYDGTSYKGLQRQTNSESTIQGEVERVAATLGAPEAAFACAGRTDAGVHATGQVVVINLPVRLEESRLCRAMNALLPTDIRVRRASNCDEEFHPRFDAIERQYLYRFCAGEPVPPLQRNFVAHVFQAVDPELTRAAAAAFQGKWELREWRSSQCQANRTFLTVDEVNAEEPLYSEDPAFHRPWWQIRVRARSFLHNQVRFMVGGIVAVGSGRLDLEELKAALSRGKRPVIVKKEAAAGLCLTGVRFRSGADPFP